MVDIKTLKSYPISVPVLMFFSVFFLGAFFELLLTYVVCVVIISTMILIVTSEIDVCET